MKPMTILLITACTGLLAGCAVSAPPRELSDARQAYSHASASPSTQFVPVELREAREALVRAEKSFQDDPDSQLTRNFAVHAYRKAKLAAAMGATASDSAATAKAGKTVQSAGADLVRQK
jgi:hypothetical protein